MTAEKGEYSIRVQCSVDCLIKTFINPSISLPHTHTLSQAKRKSLCCFRSVLELPYPCLVSRIVVVHTSTHVVTLTPSPTGMMDTVLNLGINQQRVELMARISKNPRWAYDTYRRFLQMFGSVVLGLDKEPYEDILKRAREKAGERRKETYTRRISM